ncbi:MAG: hypothetical protein J7647_31215 [Cyanobacteria bacterium SBLK]|nr:hypothetical protein [Cyanobacteria bacterium SBLK]
MVQKFTKFCIFLFWVALLWIPVGSFGSARAADASNLTSNVADAAIARHETSPEPSLDLGLLTDLQGMWYGRGWNIIAIPIQGSSTHTNCESTTGPSGFCVHAEPYCEILDITQPVSVENRLLPEILVNVGLAYDQKVFSPNDWNPGNRPPECPPDLVNREDFQQVHGETGMWLLLGEGENKIVRTFSLPRGNSVLATGQAESVDSLSAITPTGAFPVGELGAGEIFYNTPYRRLNSALKRFLNLRNPNRALGKELARGNSATVLTVSTDNLGGAIANIPSLDRPNDAEDAFQVPAFKATFWIENIDDRDDLQLQYSQTTDLDFIKDINGDLILWPHVDVSTLCKDAYCE